MEEGYLLLALLRSIAQVDRRYVEYITPPKLTAVKKSRFGSLVEYKQAKKEYRDMQRYRDAFLYFDNSLRSVEVMWAGVGLFRVHFRLPRECNFMSEESKELLKRKIDYKDDDKVLYFVNQCRTLHDDMKLKMRLADSKFHAIILFQDELVMALCAIAVIINFVVFISLEKGYFTGSSDPVYAADGYSGLVQALVIIQAIFALYKLFQTAVLRIPLIFRGIYRTLKYYVILESASKRRLKSMQATREKLIHYQKFMIVMRSSGLFIVTLLASIGLNVLIYYRFERVPIPVVVVCVIMLVYTLAVMMRNLALQPFIAKQRVLSWCGEAIFYM